MSDLLGAWSLTERPAIDQLPDTERRAMLGQLPGHPRRTRSVDAGRLWLVAREDKLAEGGGTLAYEGFLALGARPLASLLEHAQPKPEGHYVAAHRGEGDTLSLWRSLSGGERLYYARVGELVLFASALRPLLAHTGVKRELHVDIAREQLLTGHVIFGSETAIRGVHEVLPGHVLELSHEVGEQRWLWRDVLRSPRGDHQQLARQFHEALCRAIELSVPRSGPVALALSGGIDSSAIAVALREVVGAGRVHAFSYEFEDPNHSVETHYAKSVAKRLGIQRHEVFRLQPGDYHRAVLEHLWRNESPVHWPKAFLLQVARHFAELGYDRYLTGFGIGSHMSYLAELARVLPWLPAKDLALRYWKWARFDERYWLEHLRKLHPGLEPPHNRLYDLLLHLLEHEGIIRDRRRWYPPELGALLEPRGRLPEIAPELSGESLRERLQLQCFSHLISCVDVTRSEKASREVGCYRVSPAHYAGTIPFAYFPPEPPPRLWSAERLLRPGKYLLRLAYRGTLPDEVLFRKKSWGDAVASHGWRRRGRINMLRALPLFPSATKVLGPGMAEAVEAWEPHSILAGGLSFWLWRELFIERPPQPEPPSWPDLIPMMPMGLGVTDLVG